MGERGHGFGEGAEVGVGVSAGAPKPLLPQLQAYRDSLADTIARWRAAKERKIHGHNKYAPGGAATNAETRAWLIRRIKLLQTHITRIKGQILSRGGTVPPYESFVDRSPFSGTQKSRTPSDIRQLFASIVSTPAPPELNAGSVLNDKELDELSVADLSRCSFASRSCGWIYRFFGAAREMMSVRGGTRTQKRRRRRTQTRRA